MQAYSLYELNEYIKRILALNFTEPLWITCEISQLKEVRGQIYLDFVQKEENQDKIIAKASGILWWKDYLFLKRKYPDIIVDLLQEGQEVKVKVQVDFDERYGLKLLIKDVDAEFTLGQAALKRLQILETLDKEGLIGKNRGIPLPPVIQRVAVISSKQAAGYKDFMQHLIHNSYGYTFKLTHFEASVQGKNVEPSVSAGLDQLKRSKMNYDVVVIVRGGGSKLDLSGFDSEKLGRMIADFPLPVLTGIGHDIDQTVCDVVAGNALKTPTAVADFIIERNLLYESESINLYNQIRQLTLRKISEAALEIQNLENQIKYSITHIIKKQNWSIDHLQNQIHTAFKQVLLHEESRIKLLATQLDLKNPQTIMSTGYSALMQKGKLIKSISNIDKKKPLVNILHDGRIQSNIEKIET